MKTNDNFLMAGQVSNALNAQGATSSFDKDVQAEAAFTYTLLLFGNGYPTLAMCFHLLDFKAKYPQSRHIAEVNSMLASVYTKK